MSITLADRATIKFKTPLEATQLKQIFKSISNDKGFKIRYTLSETFTEDPRPDLRIGRSYNNSGGDISPISPERGFAMLGFDLQTDYINDQSKYTSLRFFIAPGYKESDINPKELEAMDVIREYFDAKL